MNLTRHYISGLGAIQTNYLKNKIRTEVIEPYVLLIIIFIFVSITITY